MTECRECGQPFEPSRRARLFCTSVHRIAYNNRRRLYGGAMFDLVMEWRFDRERGSSALADLCALAATVRMQDHRERGGRPSWSTSKRMKSINSVIGR